MKKAKVLVVDDEPIVRETLQTLLEDEYDLSICTCGEEAQKYAQEHCIDVALVDIRLPGMNGIEVLTNLKNDSALKDIPVIVLSNLAGAETAEEALKKGAFAYMVKSAYKPKEVAQKAKDFLNATYKREIVAGRNINLQAQIFSKEGLGSPTALRDMYRDITGSPRTPFVLFDELTTKFSYNSMSLFKILFCFFSSSIIKFFFKNKRVSYQKCFSS